MNREEKEILLDKLRAEYPIEELIQFDEYNISEKLKDHAFVLQQYEDFLLRERGDLARLEEIKEQLIGKAYDKFRFHDNRGLEKKEIEKYYIPREASIIKVNGLIAKQTLRVDFFTVCVKALEKMGWNMKMYLESLKI